VKEEEETLSFVRRSINSLWELELLLRVSQSPERVWTSAELVSTLRASSTVVERAVAALGAKGLVSATPPDGIRYAAVERGHGEDVKALEALWAAKPFSVTKTIMDAQSDPLRSFSDAFRLKD